MASPIDLTVRTTSGEVPLHAQQRGEGRSVVLLHGGGGPVSVDGFADLLAERAGVRVITPVHPGFGGTHRPDSLSSIAGLAELYAGMLDVLDIDDVVVIGNSMGGWIAAELALRRPPRLTGLVLVDAVGVEVAGHPAADFATFSPLQVAEHSWYDPSRAPIVDPALLPPAARDVLLGNRASLALYGGLSFDPTLLRRLAAVRVPALVLWGEADRIVDTEYGRAYAAAMPTARFDVLPRTGHVPQMETPGLLVEALRAFIAD